MSILKSIMHHWNSTSESYDTLHPETEYAQVTDFGEGTIAHLISSALASTVTACSTGSVFGKLVEKLLDASGMRYNFTNSNAWYICLGSLFGGLIIQGGINKITSGQDTSIHYPIVFSSMLVVLVNVNIGQNYYANAKDLHLTDSFTFRFYFVNGQVSQHNGHWVAFGR